MLLTPVWIINHATKYGKVWLLALPCQPISCQESITKTSEKGEKHFSWDFSFLPILYLVIESLSGLEPSKKAMLAGQKAQGPTCLLFWSARLIIAFHHTEHLCVLWDPVPAQEALEQLSHGPPPHFFNKLQFMDMQIQKARYFPPTVPGI